MPRIPQSGVRVALPGRVGPSPALAAQTGQAISRIGTAGVQIGLDLREQEIERALDRQLIHATTGLQKSYNDLALEFERDEGDPATAEARFRARAGEIRTQALEGLDERVAPFVERRALQISEPMRVSVFRNARARQESAFKADIDALELETARAIVNAPNDVAAESAQRQYETSIQRGVDSGIFDAEEQQQRLESLGKTVATAQSIRLLRENPLLLERVLSDPNGELSQTLDPVQRERLIASAQVQQRVQAEAERARQAQIEKATLDDFIQRIYSPNPEDRPTLLEVLEAPLPTAAKERFAKDITEGPTLTTDAGIFNHLWTRIHDESHPQYIQDERELVPFLNRLSPEDYNKLRTEIDRFAKPESKVESKLFAEFLDSAEDQITGRAATGGIAVPSGARRFYDFRVQAQKDFDAGIEAGKSPRDLLDPTHPDYIGKIIPRFQLSPMDAIQELGAILQGGGTETGTPGREANESPESFLDRTRP